MQEDAEDAYDLADAGLVDPTPNTDLPDPNIVAPIAGLTSVAGTAELDLRGDGSVVSRLRVNWTTTTASYMDGDAYIEIAWQDPVANAAVWNLVKVSPLEGEVLIGGVQDDTNVNIRAVAVNVLGRRSVPVFDSCYIEGKGAPPSDVAGFRLWRDGSA
jgi:hypothetical protein